MAEQKVRRMIGYDQYRSLECVDRRGPSGAVTVRTAALPTRTRPRARARGYQCVSAAPAGRRYRDT